VEYGAGDLAPYDATVTRRFDALVALSRRPATTMGAVLAKALVVSHLREWKNHETEAGELAIDLVHELAVMAERDDLDQGRLPADSALARGCSAFFIDDSLYEAAVCGGQMSQSAIKLALQRRADALDVVINHEATTIAAAVAKAEVVLHLSEWVGHDATDIGLLALAVLRDLRSISRFA
jgi:hypothetical protein